MAEFVFFPFYGPNRRSELPVVELRLRFSDAEVDDFPGTSGAIVQALKVANVLDQKDTLPAAKKPADHPVRYMELLTLTALRLQQRGGHQVTYHSLLECADDGRVIALLEHEDPTTGMAAVKLAAQLIAQPENATRAAIDGFVKQAHARALPGETRAIMAALKRRGIPWLHGDRDPLEGKIKTGQRVRRNGLLMTGQGEHSQIIDGSFAVSRADTGIRGLLSDARQRHAVMAQCGLPVSDANAETVETGHRHLLLVIGDSVTALSEAADGKMQVHPSPHPEVEALGSRLSRRLGSFPLVLHLRSPDLARPPSEAGVTVRDFDLTPDLYELLTPLKEGAQLLNDACDRLVHWLYPGQDTARIKTVAVTGTNGKTTTSQMVAHILRHTGHRPALVCTHGIFVNGNPVSRGDASAFIGHARALTSRGIDSAVLESHHGGIVTRGFAFDHCTVGICLNVTAEHLADGEIDTLEEMVGIKQALVERASEAAVLNADNPGCRSMVPNLSARRICWFSSRPLPENGARGLELPAVQAYNPDILQCRIEYRDGKEWVVLHDGDTTDLMKVEALPSTFGGAARFNLENALAAISAAWLLGIPPEAIREAMSTFSMSFQNTPGRLNHYAGLPFQAFVDFAHNPDGIKRLAEFAARLPVRGRRLLLIAAPGDRSDEHVTGMAQSAGKVFDHVVCRDYPNSRGRTPGEVPELLAATLRAGGVADENITIALHPERAVDAILGMAQAEDLVVLSVSRKEFSALHQRLETMQQQVSGGHAKP